jgi:hypothetical protein
MGLENTQGKNRINEGETQTRKIKTSNETILKEEAVLSHSLKLGYRKWEKEDLQKDAIRFGFRLGVKTQRGIDKKAPDDENKLLISTMEYGCKNWMSITPNRDAFFAGFHKGVGTERRIQKKKTENVASLFDQVKTNLADIRDTIDDSSCTSYVSINSLLSRMSSEKAIMAAFGETSETKKEELDSSRETLTKSLLSGYAEWKKGATSAMFVLEAVMDDEDEAEELASGIEDEVKRASPGSCKPAINVTIERDEASLSEREKVQEDAYKTGFNLGVNSEREIKEKKINEQLSLFGQIVSEMEEVRAIKEREKDTKSAAYVLLKTLIKNSRESPLFDEQEKNRALQKRD